MGRLGRMAVRATGRKALLEETAVILADTLCVEHCAILELEDGGDRVPLAAAAGSASLDADAQDLPDEDRLFTQWVLSADEPVMVWEWSTERRFDAADLRARGVRSSAAAGIRGRAGACGIVVVHASRVGAFTTEDAQWLQSVADLLASALDR